MKLTVACNEMVDGVVCSISSDSSFGLITPPMEFPNGAVRKDSND